MSTRFYKRLILYIFGVTVITIIILTVQAIYATENWAWFKMDYTGREGIISSYGTLIGGVLAFLSILFVLFQVYEQREQIENDKKEEKQKIIEQHENIFKLLSSFLDSIISDIKNNGSNLKKFYEAELRNPTLSNQAYFSVNKNFNRVIEMDYSSIYRSFEYFFSNKKEWENEFLNFYRNIDFYKDITPHLQENYRSQIQGKVEKKYEIQEKINSVLQLWNNIRNSYIQYAYPPFLSTSHPYFQSINKYFHLYKEYIDFLEHTAQKAYENPSVFNRPMDSDLNDLSKTYFQPFFDEMLQIKKGGQADYYNETNLIEELGNLIILIKNLNTFGINYALDLKANVDEYYNEENKNLKALIKQKKMIDEALKKKA